MADAAHSPSTPVKRSVVVSDGTYRIEPQVLWLRPSSGVTLEPVTELPGPLVEDTAELEPVEAGPSPEEIARQEAERILEAARQEVEELKRQAREQGYADGVKEGSEQGRTQGREEGQAELKETLDRWLTQGDALTEAWRRRFDGLEAEVKTLAVAIAEKIVQAHLAAAPKTVLGVIKDALRHAVEAERVTVLVNAKDIGLVKSAKEGLAALLKGTEQFEVVESEKVEPGSCVVQTKTQVIDAMCKSRLENLRDTMQGATGERSD